MVKKTESDQKIGLLERDLRLLEEYIQELFSFVPLPICFVSPKGVFLQTNPAFEAIAGCGAYEIVGEALDTFFDKEVAAKFLDETVRAGFVKNREMFFINKQQRRIPVNVFSQARKDIIGEVSSYFIGFFDLSDVKEFENDLRAAKKTLEARVAELEKFQKMIVGRELKMMGLKKENDKLKKELEKN
jgi:PAS domain S-box-containing protein